jgi:hypothetical protein
LLAAKKRLSTAAGGNILRGHDKKPCNCRFDGDVPVLGAIAVDPEVLADLDNLATLVVFAETRQAALVNEPDVETV